ncbi:unnamed protein product [Acidithrix sp. C25]|nr:unnamed protein product [Acidithrix sp. C25]
MKAIPGWKIVDGLQNIIRSRFLLERTGRDSSANLMKDLI